MDSGNVIDLGRAKGELEDYLADSRPTPERMAKADMAGQEMRIEGEGEERHWRISPILDELKRRKTLTGEEHAAACRFLREYYLGLYAGPRTVGYRERGSPSAQAVDHDTQRIHYARETEKAILSVDPLYYPALKWLVATLGEGRPLTSLGESYAPGLGSQTQSARCGAAVALLCASLCRHYGIKHRLTMEEHARIGNLSRILLEHKAG